MRLPLVVVLWLSGRSGWSDRATMPWQACFVLQGPSHAGWDQLEPAVRRCLELAHVTLRAGGLAVGSVITDTNGTIVAEGRNRATTRSQARTRSKARRSLMPR
jgi:hypothetical protein